jgi:hypothetical protein
LNKSSNAFRALSVRGVVVWRSTVVRGEYDAQLFRAFFGVTRAGTGSMHSNRLPGSKETHCAQAWRSVAHRVHLLSSPISVETTLPHWAQRTTSW